MRFRSGFLRDIRALSPPLTRRRRTVRMLQVVLHSVRSCLAVFLRSASDNLIKFRSSRAVDNLARPLLGLSTTSFVVSNFRHNFRTAEKVACPLNRFAISLYVKPSFLKVTAIARF